jgi:hypothetical protein
VVDVEHDPRDAARAAAVSTAEAVALEDAESELGGEGIASPPGAVGWQGASRMRRTWAARRVPAPDGFRRPKVGQHRVGCCGLACRSS